MYYTCNIEHWKGLNNRLNHKDGVDLSFALSQEAKYRKEALLYGAKHDFDHILYSIKQYDFELDIITTISYFTATTVTSDELLKLTQAMPNAVFGVLHSDNIKSLCLRTQIEEKSKRIEPITLKKANQFVKANHRHHDNVTGCKFSIGLTKELNGERKLIGVAICGRPVSRELDNGFTLEVNRLCVTEEGDGSSCSMLYSRCIRVAREMGYSKVITYILASEDGTSLKASGFTLEEDLCGGKEWTGKRKNTHSKTPPKEYKQRWAKQL